MQARRLAAVEPAGSAAEFLLAAFVWHVVSTGFIERFSFGPSLRRPDQMSGAGFAVRFSSSESQDRQCYFDNFHIQKLRSAAITASGALIQSGIV
jgi:hypothetical protein